MFDHWVCQWRSHSVEFTSNMAWLNHKSYQCSGYVLGTKSWFQDSEPDQRWNIIRVWPRYSSFISSSLIHFFASGWVWSGSHWALAALLISLELEQFLFSAPNFVPYLSKIMPPPVGMDLQGWLGLQSHSAEASLMTPGPSSSTIQELPRRTQTLPYHSPRNVSGHLPLKVFWEKGLGDWIKRWWLFPSTKLKTWGPLFNDC